MEEKKTIKISLPVFIITLVLILVIIIGLFSYVIVIENDKSNERIEELNSQIELLENSIASYIKNSNVVDNETADSKDINNNSEENNKESLQDEIKIEGEYSFYTTVPMGRPTYKFSNGSVVYETPGYSKEGKYEINGNKVEVKFTKAYEYGLYGKTEGKFWDAKEETFTIIDEDTLMSKTIFEGETHYSIYVKED